VSINYDFQRFKKNSKCIYYQHSKRFSLSFSLCLSFLLLSFAVKTFLSLFLSLSLFSSPLFRSPHSSSSSQPSSFLWFSHHIQQLFIFLFSALPLVFTGLNGEFFFFKCSLANNSFSTYILLDLTSSSLFLQV